VLLEQASAGGEHFAVDKLMDTTCATLAKCFERQIKEDEPAARAAGSLVLPAGWPPCR
jgi:hypothetical protein